MQLTIDKLKDYWLPWNASRVNNYPAAVKSIAVYNDSVNLYQAVKLVIQEDFTPTYQTDLTSTPSSTSVLLASSTGDDATIAAATTSLAGVMTASDKTNLTNLITLSGVSAASTNLGVFTGGIIQDSRTIKQALQDLETSIEDGSGLSLGDLTSATTAITVIGGNDSVFVPTGVSLTFNPGNVDINDLDGTIGLSQLPVSGVPDGSILQVVSGNWNVVDFPEHNELASLQGGTTNQYYHLTSAVHSVLSSSSTNRLVGRYTAGSGGVQSITLPYSVVISGTGIQLVNDTLSPGNSYYYGTNSSGTKGYYALPSTVSTVGVTDSADIDFTITNPTTTPNVTGELTETGVIAGTYGTIDSIPEVTVDSKGRITSITENSVLIDSSSVSDFSEAVDDRVSALLVAGSGISLSYNDGANTLTISSSTTYTDENAQDAVGNILTDSADIDFTYSDPTPSITGVLTTTGVSANSYGSSFGSSYPQFTVDSKGRITAANNRLIQINTTQISNFEEAIDDRVSVLLQAGTDITLSYNDVAGTLTINSTASGGMGSGYDTIQEETVSLTNRTILNFTGDGITAVDNSGATRTDVSLDDTLNALATYDTDGFLVQTATDTFAGREITAGSAAITIADGDGVAGDPVIDLDPSAVDINDFAGPLDPANGGTGLGALGTANQLLGVNSGATDMEWKTLTGTSNRVTVTHGTGSITLTTPQDTHTAATPTFAGMNLTATSPVLDIAGSSTANITMLGSGSGGSTLSVGGTGGGFIDTQTNTTAGAVVTLWQSKASSSSTGPSIKYYVNDGADTASGDALGYLYFTGRGTSAARNGAAISSNTTGAFSSSSSPAYLSFLTTPTSSTTLVERMRINSSGEVQFRAGSGIRLYDSDNTNYIAIVPPATGSLTADYTLTLPVNDGTSGDVLTTDGSGNLSWETAATIAALVNTIYSGDGTVTDGREVTQGGDFSWYGTSLAAGKWYDLVIGQGGVSVGAANLYLEADSNSSLSYNKNISGNKIARINLAETGVTLYSDFASSVIHLQGTPKITMGSDATGDIWYRNSSGNLSRLPIGTSGQVLTVSGSSLPSWAAASGGGSPAGSNYQIQYYNSGSFGADANINVTPGAQPKLVVGTTTAAATLHARNHNSAGSLTLLTENSSGNNIFQVLSSGILQLGDNELTPRFWQSATTNGSVSYTADGITFQGAINSTTSDVLGVYHASTAVTSGTTNALKVVGEFAPTSGTATYATFRVAPTINQTGTASGDTYGIIVAPTLTSIGAGGFRGLYLPYSDSDAWGVYQDGTLSPNFFAGDVTIGTSGLSAPAYTLEVAGEVGADHFIGTGSTPGITAGSSSVIGTGASVSISGTDSAYEVTLTTGTGASVQGNAFVVTFDTAYANAPYTVFSASDADASAAMSGTITLMFPFTTTTTTTMSFYVHAVQASTTYKWTFMTIGK